MTISPRRGAIVTRPEMIRIVTLVHTSGLGRCRQRMTALATRSGGCMNKCGVFARRVALTTEHPREFSDTRFLFEERDFGDRPAILHLLRHQVMRVRWCGHLR